MLKQSGASVEEVTWAEDPGLRICGGLRPGRRKPNLPTPAWQNVHIARSIRKQRRSCGARCVSSRGRALLCLVFARNQWPDGKTSASAPVWAALIARINAKLPRKSGSDSDSAALQKTGRRQAVGEISFHDITIGSNAVYPDPNKAIRLAQGSMP